MPAFYEPDQMSTPDRPVFRVTLPNGTRLPMAASEEQLRSAGALPVRNEAPPDNRLALGADMAPQRTLAPSDETRPAPAPTMANGQVRADSPQFQAMLDRNAKAAENAGAARPAPPTETSNQRPGDVVMARPAGSSGPQQPRNPFQLSPDQAGAVMQAAMAPRYQRGRDPGFVPTSVTRVTEMAPSDEGREGISAANRGVLSAHDALAEKDAAVARQEATALEMQTDQMRQNIDAERQRRVVVDAEVGRLNNEVNQRLETVKNMPAPRATGMFHNSGVLGRMTGFLAVFMGSLARQRTGGNENMGIKGLNDGLERDLAQQRDALAKAGGDLTNAKGALADFVRIHGDPDLAAKELKLHQLEYVKQRGDAMAARARSDMVSSSWAMKRAELEALQAKEAAELEAQQRGRVQEQYAYDPGRPGGWVRPGLDAGVKALEGYSKAQDAYAGATGMTKPDAAKALYMGGQFVGNAATEDEGKTVRGELASAEEFDALMSDLAHMRENWNSWSPEKRKAALSTNTFAKLSAKGDALFKMGVLAGPDMDLLHGAIPENPNAMVDPGQTAQLRQTQNLARRKMDIRVRNQGVPVTTLPWQQPGRRAD